MLSILVGHSYFLCFDRKQFERARPYPPLATLHTAALLRAAGHQVALFDAMLADGAADFATQLGQQRPQVVVLYEDNFNYLSKMCLARMRQAACEMIAMARSRDAAVIVAGSDATDAPQPYLDAGADAVVAGEGLAALLALIGRLDSAPQLRAAQLAAGIAGMAGHAGQAGRDDPGAADHPTTAPPPLLSQSTLPAWDLIDAAGYRNIWRRAHGYFSLNMAASRGCPFHCNWCAKPIWGNQYLQRPAEEVAAEMRHLKEHFAPDHIWFADDIFGFRPAWVETFAAAARVGGMVPFTIQSRADLMSERMAAALGQAGCVEVWIGAESGSQRILDAMDKGTRVDQILTARSRLRMHGIRVGFFIQIGYLGEELHDILATRELIDRAQPDDIGVSVSYPLPGTPFHDTVKAQLRGKTHWSESNDLAMMFKGTYRSEFYRAVRNLLHRQVEVQKLNGPCEDGVHTDARMELQARWSTLLQSESRYRTEPADACTTA